jgi:hypothetical protein
MSISRSISISLALLIHVVPINDKVMPFDPNMTKQCDRQQRQLEPSRIETLPITVTKLPPQ